MRTVYVAALIALILVIIGLPDSVFGKIETRDTDPYRKRIAQEKAAEARAKCTPTPTKKTTKR